MYFKVERWTFRDAGKRAQLVVLSLLLVSNQLFAHGGGLDRYGCHNNRRTGDYHCHRGGPPVQAPAASSYVNPSASGARTLQSPTASGYVDWFGTGGGATSPMPYHLNLEARQRAAQTPKRVEWIAKQGVEDPMTDERTCSIHSTGLITGGLYMFVSSGTLDWLVTPTGQKYRGTEMRLRVDKYRHFATSNEYFEREEGRQIMGQLATGQSVLVEMVAAENGAQVLERVSLEGFRAQMDLCLQWVKAGDR